MKRLNSDLEKLRGALRRRVRWHPFAKPSSCCLRCSGAWQVGVDWRTALPAYFQCLAEGAPPDEFTREVGRAIDDFADYERPRHLAAARRVANPGQKTALRGLPARKRRC